MIILLWIFAIIGIWVVSGLLTHGITWISDKIWGKKIDLILIDDNKFNPMFIYLGTAVLVLILLLQFVGFFYVITDKSRQRKRQRKLDKMNGNLVLRKTTDIIYSVKFESKNNWTLTEYNNTVECYRNDEELLDNFRLLTPEEEMDLGINIKGKEEKRIKKFVKNSTDPIFTNKDYSKDEITNFLLDNYFDLFNKD